MWEKENIEKNEIFHQMLMKISIFCFSRETYYRRDLGKPTRNPEVKPLGSICEKWFRDDFSDNGLGIFEVQIFFQPKNTS